MTQKSTALALPDGGAIHIRGEAAELRDPEGRLLVRYANGVAEIAVPAGDLVLSAPAGKVVIRAGQEVLVDAPRVAVKADESALTTGHATVIADRIATTASAITQRVERLEITAGRLIERTRDAYREATDLAETRAGRIRALVKDVYTLYARRTTMASKEETSIDGSKVLLG